MNLKAKMVSSLEEQLSIKGKAEERVKDLERQIIEVRIILIILVLFKILDFILSFPPTSI